MVQDMNWETQKICSDISGYELVVEKQKTTWECEQKRESWNWLVSYHGSVVAKGAANDKETAKDLAVSNLPESIEPGDDDCGCDA